MNRTLIPTILALALCTVFAPAGFAQRLGRQQVAALPKEPKLPQMSPEARHAILAEAGLAKIDGCRRITEDGEEVFEVDITRNGIERSFTVALDGTLRSRQVFIGELKLPVQYAVTALQRVGKVNSIHWCDEDGDHVYEVEVLSGEDKRFYTVGLDGTFQAIQVHMNEVPEPVQKTIREQVGKARILDISRSELDAGQVFDVLLFKDRKRRVVSVGIDGSVQAVQVAPAELPQPVQKTITATAGPAKVIYAGRCEEDGDVTFSVVTVDNGVKKEFLVGLSGELLATTIPFAEAPEVVQKALREKVGVGRVLHVQKLADGSGYDADLFTGGKKITVSVALDGKLR
ncbi:MAG: hypothetical protein NT105_13250 [Verrucomicrobia bacterium]|nr:hypothetical protein [Verrucomicrobiota bacterium]